MREQAAAVDLVLVTGGLGGTPDDLTREAVAAAFGVPQVEQPDVAARLRARFTRDPEYAARWALLPEGSRPLENPLGGAPGFAIGNVWVMPGLPAEMEAMFDSFADELRAGDPIGCWRRTYRTTEGRIVSVLQAMTEHHPGVLVGSYPSRTPDPCPTRYELVFPHPWHQTRYGLLAPCYPARRWNVERIALVTPGAMPRK